MVFNNLPKTSYESEELAECKHGIQDAQCALCAWGSMKPGLFELLYDFWFGALTIVYTCALKLKFGNKSGKERLILPAVVFMGLFLCAVICLHFAIYWIMFQYLFRLLKWHKRNKTNRSLLSGLIGF